MLSTFVDVDFRYIDVDICWIQGGSPLVYSFGIPVGLVMLMNITFFTRTAVALKETMKAAKRAKSNSDSLQRFAVYIKLAFLMGFTWVFGFMSGLTDIDGLNYLFIVTNSLQGVYICVSFTMSSRVRNMYKHLCGSRETVSSTTQDTTQGSQTLSQSKPHP